MKSIASIPDRNLSGSGTIQTGKITVGTKTSRRWLGRAIIATGIRP